MSQSGPWQHFADYYYDGTPYKERVDSRREEYREKFSELCKSADDIGDALAQAIITRRVSRAAFEKALAAGIHSVPDAAQELVDFFASVDQIPVEIDMISVARGARVFRHLPPLAAVVHGAIAGFAYAAINPTAAIPLSMNKSIVDATHRRYMNTEKYVADTVSKGGQDRYSDAFKTACRVRLVHSFVRSEISKHAVWNFAAYERPIHNGTQLAAAAVTGPWAIPYAEKRGYRYSFQEKNDIAMFSAYIACLQGVPAKSLITSYDEYSEFLYFAVTDSILPLPEDKEKALTVLKPLLDNGYPISDNRLIMMAFNDYLLVETRKAFGAELSDEYGIPSPFSGQAVAPIASILNRALAVLKGTPMLGGIYAKIGDAYWEKTVPSMLERITGSARAKYEETASIHR